MINSDTQNDGSPSQHNKDAFGILDSIKQILDNLRTPERLDAHPWVNSLTVREAVRLDPSLVQKSPGTQLVLALGGLFRQLMPNRPPVHDGKRLDTRWGRFGILAANYFAPLHFGTAYPHTLRDAWRRIDQAILLFAFHTTSDHLSPDQIESYRLIGDEVDLPAKSTISDWHRSGIQDLADLLINHEKSLGLSPDRHPISPAVDAASPDQHLRKAAIKPSYSVRIQRSHLRWPIYLVLATIVVALVFAGIQVYRIDRQLRTVQADMTALKGFNPSTFQPQDLQQIGPILDKTQVDLISLRSDVSPWLWLTDRLGWIPLYGGDIRYAGGLLETASDLTQAADSTYRTVLPIWDALHQAQDLKASDLTSMLIDAGPSLQQAQSTLAQAADARQRIDASQLTPSLRDLLTRTDSYRSTFDQALTVALAVPGLLGATATGPKTYLIMIENEDELRPTGGFVTAVGKVVVWNGQLINLSIADSYSVDDLNKAYPAAPWQMQSFMNIPIMVFRDTSWFTDFPTAAKWAEYLYAYTNNNSVNGVIAIDQHVLATLLTVTSPVFVPAINTTVTADNIRTVMRAQKVPPPPDQRDPNWYRKQFMNPISSSILQRLTSGQGISWEHLLRAMIGELDQRHILVQLDDPTLTKLLADRGWDGAVRNPGVDFLMVVDTNMGYNKTNAVVTSRLSYDVDLTHLSSPASTLTVFHQNDAQGNSGICNQRPIALGQTQPEFWYPIDRCYFDYLRVYIPAGSQLTAATPHFVSTKDMATLDQDVPARVDLLDETIHNVQGFGTLLMVPMQSSLQTSFQFNLQPSIIQPSPSVTGGQIYNLKIEKQAGTLAVPVILRVHLPQGSKIENVNLAYVQDGSNLLFNLALKSDLYIRIEFRP